MLSNFRDAKRDVMANIHLSNLSLPEMKDWLSSILYAATAATNNKSKAVVPIPDDQVQELNALAEKVYSKTRGNIFFTIQALDQLHRNGIIVFEQATGRWSISWPEQSMMAQNGSNDGFELADSVVQMVAERLRLLRPQTRTALTLASFIRSNFDLEALEAVMTNESMHQNFAQLNDLVFMTSSSLQQADQATTNAKRRRPPSLESLLEEAVLEGLLHNTIGESTYRFAHDRIQQAAQTLIPLSIKGQGGDGKNNRDKLRYRIGACLWDYYNSKKRNHDGNGMEDHGMMFVAADHLNSVQSTDHMYIATINLAVGQKARSLVALQSAASYLKLANDALIRYHTASGDRTTSTATSALEANIWEKSYDFAIELYEAQTSVELAIGNYDFGYKLGEEVLNRAKNIEEKMRVYKAMATAMGAEGRDADCLEVSKKAAQALGAYPKRCYAVHAGLDMMWLQRYFRDHTDDEVLSLPTNQNKTKLVAMRFMSQICNRSFRMKSILSMAVATMKMIRLSIRHGLNEDTAMALSFFGTMCVFRGDYQSAQRYAKLSLKILNRCDSKSIHGGVLYMVSFFIGSWSQPIASVSSDLKTSYQLAMESGDFEAAMVSWFSNIALSFFAGRSLELLLRASEQMTEQMKLYKVKAFGDFNRQFIAMLGQLAGRGAIDWEEVVAFAKQEPKDGNDRYDIVGGVWVRMSMATYFLKYDVLEELCRFYFDEGGDPLYIMMTTSLFSKGIMAAGRYRHTSKKKYLKMLKQAKAELRQLAIKNGNNCLHRGLILQAEETAIQSMKGKKSKQAAARAYDSAIAVSLKLGHRQEAALCHELAAEYLLFNARQRGEHAGSGMSSSQSSKRGTRQLTKQDDKVVIRDHFTRAMELYSSWGGVAKAEDLKRRRKKYIDMDKVARTIGANGDSDNGANGVLLVSMPSDVDYGVNSPLGNGGGDEDDLLLGLNDTMPYQDIASKSTGQAPWSVASNSVNMNSSQDRNGSKTSATDESPTKHSLSHNSLSHGTSSNGGSHAMDSESDDVSVLSNGSAM
mmetsp:Transcript_12244/g.35505  ORF Transcript_12244/g.35505 Transcript_12244/m.35505 type:complete len:1032 (-) Transcript_12244:534-3629(-)